MNVCVLTHYTYKDFEFDPNRKYGIDTFANRPHGLWLCEGEEWKEWVEENMPDWPKRIARCTRFKLKPEANLFTIDTLDALMALPVKWSEEFPNIQVVDWEIVRWGYSGLYVSKEMIEWANNIVFIASGYLTDPRRHFVATRDVPSWCIWDLNMVEEVHGVD